SSLTRCRSSVTPAMALNSPADNVVGTVTCGTEGGLHGGGPTTPSGPFTGRYWSSVSVLRMSFAKQSCTAFAPSVTEPPPIVTIRSAPASRAIAAASITGRGGVCGSIRSNRPAKWLPSARRTFATSSVVRLRVPLAITNTRPGLAAASFFGDDLGCRPPEHHRLHFTEIDAAGTQPALFLP